MGGRDELDYGEERQKEHGGDARSSAALLYKLTINKIAWIYNKSTVYKYRYLL